MSDPNFTLDFRTFMSATDYDRSLRSTKRDAEDWLRLYDIAADQVAKYGLDGSKIPVGSKCLYVHHAEVHFSKSVGYRGISAPDRTFLGPVDNENWADKFFHITSVTANVPIWVYRPSWWRFIAVVE